MSKKHIPVRRARQSDLTELIRLRHLLLDKKDAYYASDSLEEHQQWERSFAVWLPVACRSDDTHIAVIEMPARSALAACGIAVIDTRPPGPGLLNGRCGWIQSIVTDPSWRSRGLASAIVESLMQWLAAAKATRVILHTTPEAKSLYLQYGFKYCGEDALVAAPTSQTAPP